METSQENVEEDDEQEENQHNSPKVRLQKHRLMVFFDHHICLSKEAFDGNLHVCCCRSGGKTPGESADEAQQQLQHMGLAERDTSDSMDFGLDGAMHLLQLYFAVFFIVCFCHMQRHRPTLIHALHGSWFIFKCHVC